jgi:hypothetical protein
MQFSKKSVSGCEIKIVVSSAKNMGLDCKLMVVGRSLIYLRKIRGSSTEP